MFQLRNDYGRIVRVMGARDNLKALPIEKRQYFKKHFAVQILPAKGWQNCRISHIESLAVFDVPNVPTNNIWSFF